MALGKTALGAVLGYYTGGALGFNDDGLQVNPVNAVQALSGSGGSDVSQAPEAPQLSAPTLGDTSMTQQPMSNNATMNALASEPQEDPSKLGLVANIVGSLLG